MAPVQAPVQPQLPSQRVTLSGAGSYFMAPGSDEGLGAGGLPKCQCQSRWAARGPGLAFPPQYGPGPAWPASAPGPRKSLKLSLSRHVVTVS